MLGPFSVGDVVILKSGGPEMTVRQVRNSRVECLWFEGAVCKTGEFDVPLLFRSRSYDPSEEEPDSTLVDNFG